MQRDMELPPVVFGAGMSASRWGCDLNLFWKYVSPYESLRFAEGAALQPLGDFNTVDLVVGKRLGEGNRTRVYAEVKNLADTEHSTVVGYPDYGRRIMIGLDHMF